MAEADPYNATIVRRIDVHETIALFRIRYDDVPTPEFEPGQFVTLGLVDPNQKVRANSPAARRRRGPRLIRRAYSIASPPAVTDYLEFYIVHVPGGKFTDLLWPMGEGDRLFMSERVDGVFTLDGVPQGRDLVMVATGTGLAPFRAMYHHYRHTDRWAKFILFDSCRHVRDFGYREEMEKLAAGDESLLYLPTVTRENWPGLQGRVTLHLEPGRFETITGRRLDPATCNVFLCGNPDMVDDCEAHLLHHGFVTADRDHPDGNIHLERYW